MLSRRVSHLKASSTLALAAKAKELAKQGRDIISLSLGEPDWDTIPVAAEAGISAIRSGITKYTPANGSPELRQAIAEQVSRDTGVKFTSKQVTVTSGAKFTIFSALQSVVDPGDEVLLLAPYWVSYPTMIELADGRPVVVETSEKSRFRVTPEGLDRAIHSKTKALLLNSPSNPTGEYYSESELEALAAVLRRHPHVVVLSDDIYNRLVFDRVGTAPHLLNVAPDLATRTILISGASKSFSMTGWRLGWAAGPEEMITAMSSYQSQAVGCPSSIAQMAVLAAIKTGDVQVRESIGTLRERRDVSYDRLCRMKGVEVVKPNGAFYIWPKIDKLFGRSFRGRIVSSSSVFSEIFLEEFGVAVVPGADFGVEGYLRISFTLDQSLLNQAYDRLEKFIGELSISSGQ